MPVFEYQCNECNKKFDHYHKSINNIEPVNCPVCNSGDNKKLLSSFSASINNSSGYKGESCSNGSCGGNYGGGCASGMCGLN